MTRFMCAPVFLRAGMTLRRAHYANGVMTVEATEGDGVAAIIALDTRLQAFDPVPKVVQERIQLERFRFDRLVRTGILPFDAVRRGNDPPDFQVEVGGNVLGLDVSILTLENRRLAYQLFDSFINQVVLVAKGLEHLRST